MTKHTPSARALTFHDQKFTITHRNGQPWLRVAQIGRALGYVYPDSHMTRVYKQHAAEFTDSMTSVVKLKTKGGEQEVRIFSLRGAHLLGMLSRTKRAAEFRRWVLDILEAQNGAEAQHGGKLGTNATTVQPAMPTMLEDKSTPAALLAANVQAAIDRKAWALAHEAYELCREHLAQRVADIGAAWQPQHIHERRALDIVGDTTLDMALTPQRYTQLAAIFRMSKAAADVAGDNLAKMQDELNRLTNSDGNGASAKPKGETA